METEGIAASNGRAKPRVNELPDILPKPRIITVIMKV